MPGLAVIAHTVWGAAGSSLHDPRNRLGDALGRRLDLAVAVESGRITAVVPAAEAAALGVDRVVDLGDATLMPGFVDAHVHLSATGLADHGADLRQARSVAELLDRLQHRQDVQAEQQGMVPHELPRLDCRGIRHRHERGGVAVVVGMRRRDERKPQLASGLDAGDAQRELGGYMDHVGTEPGLSAQ